MAPKGQKSTGKSKKAVKVTSVQDDVKLVLEHAKKQKLMHANPTAGKWTTYTVEGAEQHFSEGHDWMGVAANLFYCNLSKWAVVDQDMPKAEAAHYGKEHYGGSQPVEIKKPIGIAVIGEKSPGPKGEWRRISLDKQTYGFLCEWASLLREEPWGEEQQARCELFEKAALHCPMRRSTLQVDGLCAVCFTSLTRCRGRAGVERIPSGKAATT